MKKHSAAILISAVVLGGASCIASAGVCDTAWDADKIVNTLSGRPSYLKIPLKDKNQNTNEVTLAQVRAFHDAKEKIARAAGMSPTFIICGDRDPNAFASSGSKGEVVGVTLGMLRLADGDPDMAAAVIGHEFAHHVKRHGAASQSRDAVIGLIGLIAGIALEYNIQKKHGVEGLGLDLGQAGSSLVSRKFDRDQEREADDLGFQYMIAAGFNPLGSVKLAERFSRLGHGGGGWFFDSHPGWDERGDLFKTKIAASPEAQQIIARASTTPRTAETGGASSGTAVAFAPSYQASEGQQAFQAGLALFREGKHAQALEKWRSGANSGYAPAQWALGYLFEKGQGTQPNISEAASWYRKAAEQGLPGAQLALGGMYERGQGVSQSDSEAFTLFSKAADRGYPPAIVALGSMYERGKGTAKDASKAFELYKKASDLGAAPGHYALARAYGSGIGVEKNLTEAGNLLRKAADMGNEAAQVTLGAQYMQGSGGMSKNQEEAIIWFKKAAEKSYPSAYYQLGAAYESGAGVPLDIGTARDYYTKAAKSGLKDAEVALSRMKSQEDNLRAAERASGDKTDAQQCDRFNAFEDAPERGIRKAYFGFIDTDQALPPCLAAYKKNPKNTRIQAQLARIYFQQGKFVEGVELAKSAMKDQRIAFVLLAYAYRHGIGGVQIDLAEAAKLLQQGVDRGEPEAMNDLGGAYAQGKGVEKDERRALDLLQRAADTGDLEAIYNLAGVRFSGRLGATKDVDEALRLMQKSADSGLPIAQLRLGMILATREKRMTPEAQRYVSSARDQIERFANQGSAWARAALGEIYERGVGVSKDPTRAFDLYRMAASHSNVTAMTRLGVAYLDGIGTDKNPTEGKQWLEKAAKMGSEAAEKKLREVSGG